MMGSAWGCLRCAEKSLLIVVSAVLLATESFDSRLFVHLTMYDALIRAIVSEPLTRSAPPICTLDPAYTRKVPACNAMRRYVHAHDAVEVVRKRCGGLRIWGGKAAEAGDGERRGIARAFAFECHCDKDVV